MLKIESMQALQAAFLSDISKLYCLAFFSENHEDFTAAEQLQRALSASSRLLWIQEADASADIFTQYSIAYVPCFVILNANLTVWRILRDASPADVLLAIEEFSSTFKVNLELERTKFDQIFSRFLPPGRFVLLDFASTFTNEFLLVRAALQKYNIPYKSLTLTPFKGEKPINILAHLIRFAAPSLLIPPVVYINGHLFGSAAEFEEYLHQESQLIERLQAEELSRMESLLKKSPILLLFDSNHKADSTQQLGDALRAEKVMFALLDCAGRPVIVRELERRLGIQREKWPCVLAEGKALPAEQLLAAHEILKKYAIVSPIERAKALINSHPVFVFMKGSPEFPQCGFSRQLIEILVLKGAEFGSYNVLADLELRESLKELSQWKTYPQLYIKGELIGGLDIVREMDAAGEFDAIIKPYIPTN